jgi:ATP-binding cassette subfamily F protein 3
MMIPMIRNILGGFLFSGDDINKKVGVLSGGERNRLALAKMLLNPSNVLLLDEPTNHLDLDSKEVLLEALSDYGGTLIFVSHDRYFVDNLAAKVVDVGGGQAQMYPGGYEDFVEWKKRREAGLDAPVPTARPRVVEEAHPPAVSVEPRPKAAPGKPAPARSAAPTPQMAAPQKAAPPKAADPMAPRLRPASPVDRQAHEREARKLKARVAELEKAVAVKEQAVRDLEHAMATPGFYDDRAQADKATADHKALTSEVAELMQQWEDAQGAAEAHAALLPASTSPARPR